MSTIFNVKQVAAGGGRHAVYLTFPQLVEQTKYYTLSEALLLWMTALTKISVCIFVMRIPNSKRLKDFLLLVIAYLAIINSVIIVVFLAQCKPIQALWNPTIHGSCLRRDVITGLAYLQGGSSFVTPDYGGSKAVQPQ